MSLQEEDVKKQGPLTRYCRQYTFPGVGLSGQRKLSKARVVVVGCGALGTVISDSLARAGVGELVLVDRDLPELSNLQRQSLFDEDDMGRGLPKSVIAAEKLRRVNSSIRIEARVLDLKPYNIVPVLEGASLVMDALDNLEARYLLNDACVKLGLPWIYCAALGSTGMTFDIQPGKTPCLRCLFPHPPPTGSMPTCASAGILGPAAHAIASVACSEALKFLTGNRRKMSSGIIYLDVWDFSVSRVDLKGSLDRDCPCCSRGDYEFLSGKAATSAVPLCGRMAVQVSPPSPVTLSLEGMAGKLKGEGILEINEYMVRVKLAEAEMILFPDGRAIFQGIEDPVKARSLYSDLVGM